MAYITVVIPTRNEVEALPRVVSDLWLSLRGLDFQILIVDDGTDNLPEVIGRMDLPGVSFTRRAVEESNGLAGAVIYGLRKATGKFVAAIDGDGQHPAGVIRKMLEKAERDELDMVMASRYTDEGSTEGLEGRMRKFYSNFLRMLPRIVFPARVARATDPLAGCFLVRTGCLHPELMKAIGFKISLEVLLFSDIRRYGEVSYAFHYRIGGKTKTNFKIGLEYFFQIASLFVRYYVLPKKSAVGRIIRTRRS